MARGRLWRSGVKGSSSLARELRGVVRSVIENDGADRISILRDRDQPFFGSPDSGPHGAQTEEVLYEGSPATAGGGPGATNERMARLQKALTKVGIEVRLRDSSAISQSPEPLLPRWDFEATWLPGPHNIEVLLNYVAGPLSGTGELPPSAWRTAGTSSADFTNAEVRVPLGGRRQLYIRAGVPHRSLAAVSKAVTVTNALAAPALKPFQVVREFAGPGRVLTGDGARILHGDMALTPAVRAIEVSTSRDNVVGMATRLASVGAAPITSQGTARAWPMGLAEAEHKLVLLRDGETLPVDSPGCGRIDIRMLEPAGFARLLEKAVPHRMGASHLYLGPSVEGAGVPSKGRLHA